MTQIRFSNTTLPQCCYVASVQMDDAMGEMFHRIYERTLENKGMPFLQILAEEVRAFLKPSALKIQDMEAFLYFITAEGCVDEKSQVSHMEQGIYHLEKLAGKAEEEMRIKGKLAMWVSTLSGILIVILLV